jgi:glycosyltransferase involved in cell wall biosynthesis
VTSRAFRIGIAPATLESFGGVYQYGQVMLSVLADLRGDRAEEFVVLGDGLGPRSPVLSGNDWEVNPLTPPTPARKLAGALDRVAQTRLPPASRDLLHAAHARLRRRSSKPDVDSLSSRPEVRDWLRQCGIDLVIYPAPRPLAFEAQTPYVMAVHDLQHRIHPEFPEVGDGGQLRQREYVFRNGIRHATLIIVDSEIGMEDVLEFYGEFISSERVGILPFLPATPPAEQVSDADRDRVRSRYRLSDRYLFYPAQLWPHKNHRRIVEALGLLHRSDGLEIPLILVGATSGPIRRSTFAELKAIARTLGLEESVRHLGFVPAADMPSLYAGATALVMPTFFGPTNIPVLEAWALGCPVLTSAIRGVREQAGDAAVLADPTSVESIAEGIRRLWLDEQLRDELVARGRARLRSYTRQNYSDRLALILDRARALVSTRPRHHAVDS